MKFAPVFILSLAALGCAKPDAEAPGNAAAPATQPVSAAPSPKGAGAPNPATAPAGGSPTISQYTPTNIGGATPVNGMDSIDGAASGAGQVAKDRARGVAAKVSSQGDPAASPPADGN